MLRSGLRKTASMSRALVDQSFARGFSSQTGRLDGKVALITGGASGIGRATAAKFIRHGAKVVIADFNPVLGRAAAADLGSDAAFIECDVTDEPSVAAAVDFSVSQHNRLDIAFCNAGIPCRTAPSVVDLDLTAFDNAMKVNVCGTVTTVKHAARVMIPEKSGSVILTASVTGIMGGMSQLTYAVSKSAVLGMMRSAVSELGFHGIRVNSVSPFAVPTPFVTDDMRRMFPGVEDSVFAEMFERAGALKGARCDVDDVADAAVYLASDEAKYVSGHNLVVDGGFTCFKSFDFSLPDQRD